MVSEGEAFDWLGKPLEFGERPAIVVIDVQYGMTDPEHPVGAELSDMVKQINRVLLVARENAVPVVFTVISYPEGNPGVFGEKAPELATFTPDSRWTDLDARLNVGDEDPIVVEKRHQSAFFETELDALLRDWDVDTLVVVGCSTSGCVRATVTDANALGYPTFIPTEAVSDRSYEQHRSNLVDMDQKLADVLPIDVVLRSLEMTTHED